MFDCLAWYGDTLTSTSAPSRRSAFRGSRDLHKYTSCRERMFRFFSRIFNISPYLSCRMPLVPPVPPAELLHRLRPVQLLPFQVRKLVQDLRREGRKSCSNPSFSRLPKIAHFCGTWFSTTTPLLNPTRIFGIRPSSSIPDERSSALSCATACASCGGVSSCLGDPSYEEQRTKWL